MISLPDFEKKQIVFVFANDGEKLSLRNDNLIVKDEDGNIKLQCTCYRLFMVYIIGHCSVTTPFIRNAKKYGFFIILMTSGFRLYNVIGAEKEGNTLLKKKQYSVDGFEIAKHIVTNKIENSIVNLKALRSKNEYILEGVDLLKKYLECIPNCQDTNQLMAYEGLASKVYFERFFLDCNWKGRQPRLKRDILNSTLDIGYTLLFELIDSILACYGFDAYCGVLHKQFYMRKSLVCDIVEPFRAIVDAEVRKAYRLKQIQEKDFLLSNNQFRLKLDCSSRYVRFIMEAVLKRKSDIFTYIQEYYRAYMKGLPAEQFPKYIMG